MVFISLASNTFAILSCRFDVGNTIVGVHESFEYNVLFSFTEAFGRLIFLAKKNKTETDNPLPKGVKESDVAKRTRFKNKQSIFIFSTAPQIQLQIYRHMYISHIVRAATLLLLYRVFRLNN